VITSVGGVYGRTKVSDEPGPVYEPVPAAKQRAAMKFLADEVFTTPTWLVEESVLRRMENSGAVERIRLIQAGVVNQLLQPQRMLRLTEGETFNRGAYRLSAMLDDLRAGIWGADLAGAGPIDVWRRNLGSGRTWPGSTSS
jgi:hypothetical protein